MSQTFQRCSSFIRYLSGLTCLLLVAAICTCLSPSEVSADVERYQAVPLNGGSQVFILDTREGHAWTWTAGQGQHPGENSRFIYQGNVQRNKKLPKQSDVHLGTAPVQPDRF